MKFSIISSFPIPIPIIIIIVVVVVFQHRAITAIIKPALARPLAGESKICIMNKHRAKERIMRELNFISSPPAEGHVGGGSSGRGAIRPAGAC